MAQFGPGYNAKHSSDADEVFPLNFQQLYEHGFTGNITAGETGSREATSDFVELSVFGKQQLDSEHPSVNSSSDLGQRCGIPPSPAPAIPLLAIRSTGQQLESYTEEVWEMHKPRIRQLYIEESKSLREVMQYMKEERGFKPSTKMYKTHLAAWGIFKYNRMKNVAALLRHKQARDAAGKSSETLRAGEQLDMQQIHHYLRRKRTNLDGLLRAGNHEKSTAIAEYLCVRPPSPVFSVNLLFHPGHLKDKEIMLLNFKDWYKGWDSASPVTPTSMPYPGMFHIARFGRLDIMDSISMLLQQGCRSFNVHQFAEGGAYIRGAFVLVEFLFQDVVGIRDSRKGQPPIWIFELWNLLAGKIKLPSGVSKSLVAHIMAMGEELLPALHPGREIMRRLYHIHSNTSSDVFTQFISSVWADSMNEAISFFDSIGINAAVCLPHSTRVDRNDNQHELQEAVFKFKRVESIEDWRRRNLDFAFTLCSRSKALFHPAPCHTGILTLMWLRHSVVHGTNTHQASSSTQAIHSDYGHNKACAVKSSKLNRLEISLGKMNNHGIYDNIRVLGGDVYQIAYLHHPRDGENIATFKRRHALRELDFQKAKAMFQATSGMETHKGAWFKWLQILDDSLVGLRDQPEPKERDLVESVILHNTVRGKGFVGESMGTQYGKIGKCTMVEDRNGEDNAIEDGWMRIDGICDFHN